MLWEGALLSSSQSTVFSVASQILLQSIGSENCWGENELCLSQTQCLKTMKDFASKWIVFCVISGIFLKITWVGSTWVGHFKNECCGLLVCMFVYGYFSCGNKWSLFSARNLIFLWSTIRCYSKFLFEFALKTSVNSNSFQIVFPFPNLFCVEAVHYSIWMYVYSWINWQDSCQQEWSNVIFKKS